MYGMFVVEWLGVKIIDGENFLKQCRIPALSAGIRHSDQIGNIYLYMVYMVYDVVSGRFIIYKPTYSATKAYSKQWETTGCAWKQEKLLK